MFKVRTDSQNELFHEADTNLLFFLYFTEPSVWFCILAVQIFFFFSIVKPPRGGNCHFCPVLPRALLPGSPHSSLPAFFAGLQPVRTVPPGAASTCTADRIAQNVPRRISSYTKFFLPLYLMTRIVESPSPNLVMGVRRTSYASGLISSVRL